ncbi:taperin-like [Pipra filicauda]|uniref:Taperin-like n=1 Tax=Pipra filicauda TaxID=649802 RepID=A0A7R5L0F2_9PASS|nr:taperin-like [Pipra filicauda]
MKSWSPRTNPLPQRLPRTARSPGPAAAPPEPPRAVGAAASAAAAPPPNNSPRTDTVEKTTREERVETRFFSRTRGAALAPPGARGGPAGAAEAAPGSGPGWAGLAGPRAGVSPAPSSVPRQGTETLQTSNKHPKLPPSHQPALPRRLLRGASACRGHVSLSGFPPWRVPDVGLISMASLPRNSQQDSFPQLLTPCCLFWRVIHFSRISFMADLKHEMPCLSHPKDSVWGSREEGEQGPHTRTDLNSEEIDKSLCLGEPGASSPS